MKDKKAELRRRCRAIREGLPPATVQESSQAVCRHLGSWPLFQEADTVLTFIAFRNEIDLSQLLADWPDKRWLAPRTVTAGTKRPHLTLHRYHPDRLVRHRFGMLEPDPGLPVVDPGQVDLILTPGVAFDRRGGRLGFGGGFYDRLLPLAQRAPCVGVTYDELVLDAVPMEPWDYRVDWLVTPSGLIETDQETLS